jgi:hypothetical protein
MGLIVYPANAHNQTSAVEPHTGFFRQLDR